MRTLMALTGVAVWSTGASLRAGALPDGTPASALTPDRLSGFIQYVRWPDEAQLPRWEVCIPARGAAPPEGDALSARGRPIVLRTLSEGEGAERCQILDLTGVTPTAARALLDRTRRLPVLTIGQGDAFCSAGGVICLRPVASGGGFEVNLSALQESGLAANAQILMLGRRRHTTGGTP